MKHTLKTISLVVLLTLTSVLSAFSHEGMWIPLLLGELNESHMQASGLKLTAEDIYSVNKSSLKDAIVHFGGGCTSEIISPDGLLLTNHHCGYSSIQSHSSLENDYLEDGFWAMKREDELPNKRLTATLIVRMEDVTDKVLEVVEEGMSEKDRAEKILEQIDTLTKMATEGTHYDALIRPFYNGNEYYMFITETFKDVRLVGAPPSSIGKFGFDTDNWVWPRHTGDFSIFRIYADKDNKPAEYSEDNVPYKPKHYLPISMKGIEEGDFTMVYGFPGRTSEYLTSYAVDYTVNKSNPAKISLRKTSLSIIDDAMASDKLIRIQYAAKQSRISNAYKKWIGQNKGLIRHQAIEKKQALEVEFNKRLGTAKYKKYAGEYKGVLPAYKDVYEKQERYALARDYFIEIAFFGPEVIRFAKRMERLVKAANDPEVDDAEVQEELEKMKKATEGFFKNYHLPTDKKLFEAMFDVYYNETEKEIHPEVFSTVQSKYSGDFGKYADYLYDKSILVDKEKVLAFLNKFKRTSAKKIFKDPAYQLMADLYNTYMSKVRVSYTANNAILDSLDRIYMKGLMTVMPEKNYYPDANSTLRVTYGKVEGYIPADGAVYSYYTTLEGIIEKEDPGSKEFSVPSKLKELYEKKDYGIYGKDGEMRVCFVASNHTTGGNSGSPVLDGEGNLIGLNFDRSWESTMSDIMFNPEICRNISVDIRYVLFIIDKFAGAGHLVDEMTLKGK